MMLSTIRTSRDDSVVEKSPALTWMFTGKRRTLDRWEAGVFLAFYIGYLLAVALWLK